MIEQVCDIFSNKCFCITTNGTVKRNDELVMGAGIALKAKILYPMLPILFGKHVRSNGNIPCLLKYKDKIIISFPTKDHYSFKSDISIIINSSIKLVNIADELKLSEIYLPRPGCSNGKLNWYFVKKNICNILDNRFIVCTYEK